MADPTFRKIEIIGTSTKSFSEAAANGIAKAAETVRNMDWFEVVEHRGAIADGKIRQFQVTLQIGHRIE